MIHGGDIYTVAEITRKKPDEIIDMSSSVNPLPLPKRIFHKINKNFKLLNKYPDPEARTFRRSLSLLYDIPFENILCGNGSTELIYLTVTALKPGPVLILEPTFIEYEKACRLNEINDVEKIFTLSKDEVFNLAFDKLKEGKYSIVFICNPNNPTGWLIEKKVILNFANFFKNTIFVIDEAFIDFVPEESLIKESISLKNIIVLRSLTKFYGIAGLRFGYASGSFEIIEKLKKFKQPWSINSVAQWIAEEIIRDEEFRDKSLDFFRKEKDFFESRLKTLPLEYFSSVANFYLIKINRKGVFQHMLKKGILIRDCSNFYGLNENFIRVSVKRRTENKIFFKELEEFLRR